MGYIRSVIGIMLLQAFKYFPIPTSQPMVCSNNPCSISKSGSKLGHQILKAESTSKNGKKIHRFRKKIVHFP